jgi:hypothetical protein
MMLMACHSRLIGLAESIAVLIVCRVGDARVSDRLEELKLSIDRVKVTSWNPPYWKAVDVAVVRRIESAFRKERRRLGWR